MANQNAVENAFATTTDAGQQGDVNDASSSVAPANTAVDTSSDDIDMEAAAALGDDTQVDADDSDDDDDADDSTVEETSPDPSTEGFAANNAGFGPSRGQGELVEALKPVGDEPAEQKEVENGRPYEIVFIVRTSHGAEIEAITTRTRELIENGGGAVDNVRTSDVRRFSYTINKESEGSYVVLNSRFATGTVADLDRFFKLEEGVLRHLIVREDI
jgi:small subunit ribosomal protein S6